MMIDVVGGQERESAPPYLPRVRAAAAWICCSKNNSRWITATRRYLAVFGYSVPLGVNG